MTTKDAETELDSRFKFGPPPIQTAEDATMAYLREEITEDEYRAALGKFGTLPGQLFKVAKGTERVDAAFKNSIPDDVYDEVPTPADDLEHRLEVVKQSEEEREKATKDAEKDQPLKVAEVPAPVTSTKHEDKK